MALEGAPRRELSLFDSTCLIAGIIVGVGIYQTAPDVARGAGSWLGVLAIWAAGGLLSLCGALNYAELASAYPKEGGDYVYLTSAYGRPPGFLFGWMQLVIVRPGNIAVVAFAFATYASVLFDPFGQAGLAHGQQLYAAAAVLLLTLVNIIGVRQGKWLQNLLTAVKIAGLLAIVLTTFLSPQTHSGSGWSEAGGLEPLPLSVAMILVLFTFGGWNEMAYVAEEVKDPGRNIVRAMILGVVAVTGIYLLSNLAFLHALGYRGLGSSQAVAADAIASAFPVMGRRLVSALICISALGVVNGLVFTGARISYALGADHRVFRTLGRWDARTGTPFRALILQAGIALVLIIALGSFVDTIIYTAAAVYSFYLATTLAVIVLRRKDPAADRPYRVSGYPFTSIIFCAVCAFLIYGAVTYKPWIAAASCALILLGLPVYRTSRPGSPGGTSGSELKTWEPRGQS
jgi:APA family basic amino acid/polyamine antiporter